jgi:signal-transduction protein with cAMP-binding, CBS, and nucleotidyltransferase domain
LAAAYETLFEIRLRHQARKRADQLEVDNLIDPSELEPADIQDLKDAFRQIKAVQSALQHEFGVRP